MISIITKTRSYLTTACLMGILMASFSSHAEEKIIPPTFSNYVEPWLLQAVMEPTREGKLQMIIDVNDDGTIADWLVLNSDYPDFIDAVIRVIDQWRFNPAQLDGENIPLVFKLEFDFSKRGASLIQGNITSIYLEQFTDLFRDSNYVRNFKELDRLPEPVKIVRPIVNIETPEEERTGRVVVSFYIDEKGKVRIPIVEEYDGSPEIANAAYNAILQWEFKPPTVKGVPVVVQVKQPFKFLKQSENN